MPAGTKKKQQKSNGSGGFFFGSVSFIVICAALVLAICVFFKVSIIEVKGNQRYSTEEVLAASGIKEGDNLVFMNTISAETRLYNALIYISGASVSRKLPNKVVIEVWESGAVAVVETDSGLWLIDKNCRLLTSCKTSEAQNYVNIIGLCGIAPEAGRELVAAAEDAPRIKYLKTILTAMSERQILSDVDNLDVSNIANAQFKYNERFTVKMGKNEYVENKLEMLLGAAAKLTPEEKGIIDVSEDKKAHFSPEE